MYEVYTIYDFPSKRRKYKTEKGALRRVKELKSQGFYYGEVVMLIGYLGQDGYSEEIF